MRLASSIHRDTPLRGQARVIDVCRRAGATTYVNPSGGMELYDSSAFEREGVELRFLRSCTRAYAQLGAPFVPSLSIVDVLMFNHTDVVRDMLLEYRLVARGDGGRDANAAAPGAAW